MKHLHRQIVRMLPGPLFGWLGMLMFLLLMQFLIKYLPDIVGKGLPFGVIVELIAYNLAYMLVLAVPMSALIAALMAFGRLAETNSYMVIKSAGISLGQMIWPTLVVGGVLTAGMWYFNNDVLPEANFRAKNLWQDIQRKRPDFELQPGVFYDGLSGYSILVQRSRQDAKMLEDVLIYDYKGGSRRQSVIKAQRGWIESVDSTSYIDLILEEGEVHRYSPQNGATITDRYERLAFEQFRLRLDLSDFNFERSSPTEGYRSDRTMRTADMVAHVDSLERSVRKARVRVWQAATALLQDSTDTAFDRDSAPPLPTPVAYSEAVAPPTSGPLVGLDSMEQAHVYRLAIENARRARSSFEDTQTSINWELQRIDRYKVEIHKKRSIAVACLIFMLIGAPLGLAVGRGGLGISGALAVGIFLFYWVSLVQGEKLADRGMLQPWVGMWIANVVMAIVGLWLVAYVAFDLKATPPLHRRLLVRLHGRKE